LIFTVKKINFSIYSIYDGVSRCSPVLWCFTVGSEVDVVGFELFHLAKLLDLYATQILHPRMC